VKLKFGGIRRKTEFSPNHIENDLLIISRTADNLLELGTEIVMYDESEITPASIKEDLLFSMVQGPSGTSVLAKLEAERDVLLINSAQGVRNCYRTNLVKLLPESGIPFPKSIIVKTSEIVDESNKEFMSQKIWIKRGDVHAVHREDVTLVYNPNEASSLLREFYNRGIENAVIQDHLEGDTVKFYAVRDSEFFFWYYLNGVNRTAFNIEKLKELASRSAVTLGLFVYGGDAIILPDGSINIIDINDWPSFAPIREEASRQIAKIIYRKAEKFYDERP
jgi:glutathione synthase/RimK-type ligase-like ATP-grasp enzyme